MDLQSLKLNNKLAALEDEDVQDLVTAGDGREGGESPGAEVEVAVDGAGRGPVRRADDGVEVGGGSGDDVSHVWGGETDWTLHIQ